MADPDRLNVLLERFDALIAAPSKEEIAKLISETIQELDLKAAQLASLLEVSPISINRWMSAENVPHPTTLKALQEIVKLRVLEVSGPEGFEFYGRKVGIWSLDTFFRRAIDAKTVYVLKSMLPFQPGTNPLVRQQLKELLTVNNDLRICHGYLRDSEAAMTFLNLRKELAEAWPRNILWKDLPAEHKIMQLLGSLFASPFIIEQRDGRVDILLQVPVKVMSPLDGFDVAGYTTLFVELAETQKHRMWTEWRPLLEGIKWESNDSGGKE